MIRDLENSNKVFMTCLEGDEIREHHIKQTGGQLGVLGILTPACTE